MSLSFNGTTSRIVHTTADLGMGTNLSILCWIKMTGYGEGGVGIILGRDEGNNAFRFFSSSGNSGIKFRNITDNVPGEWGYAMALDTWYCVAVAYNRSSASNDPTFYVREVGVDSELIEVTETEIQTPNGTSEAPATGYGHGGNSSGAQCFAGLMMHLQAWNAANSEADLESASTDPGSITTEFKLHIDDTMEDVSGNGFTGTATDVTEDEEDPISFGGGGGDQNITGAGAIASAEAFGTAVLDITISPTGIASDEAFGTAAIQPGAVTISDAGDIASAESVSEPNVFGDQVLTGVGDIASGEAVGEHAILPGAVTLLPLGIGSLEAFGSPTVLGGDQTISGAGGIESGEAFGTPEIWGGGGAKTRARRRMGIGRG